VTRRFVIQRNEDVTGCSGTGLVAYGVEWPDGTVAIRWNSETPSTVIWGSIDEALKVHGHGGRTHVEWIDDELGGEYP
jgi:hypothetical protein